MIRTIMFDMGGTLEDIWYNEETKTQAARRVQEMLAAASCAVHEEETAFCAHLMQGIADYKSWSEGQMLEKKPEEIWSAYYLKEFNLPAQTIREMAEDIAGMWEVTYFHRELRPGVQETLETLKERGYRLGVISNTASLYSVFDVLAGYGIREYFENVTLSSVTGYRKPHPEIFRIALREMNVEATACAYIGDTISRDIIGAQTAGFGRTIRIESFLSAEKDRDTDPARKPDATIQEISDLLQLFP